MNECKRDSSSTVNAIRHNISKAVEPEQEIILIFTIL
jgi:hypothetical protein